jgi:MFS family permease
MLKHIYGAPYSSSNKIVNVSAIAFAGTVVGQLFFGFTSDHWSRTGSLMVSTAILIVFAILSAGAWGKNLDIFINTLIAFRFFVGVGIGGEYPAGSVGAAENSGSLKKGTRNRWFILFTNNMIDLGFVLAYLVAMIVVSDMIQDCVPIKLKPL